MQFADAGVVPGVLFPESIVMQKVSGWLPRLIVLNRDRFFGEHQHADIRKLRQKSKNSEIAPAAIV